MKKGIVPALSAVTGAVVSAVAIGKTMVEKVEKASKMSDKHLALFQMMNQWVRVKQEGKNLSEYFEKNNYKKIAIYGMSYAGETLVEELKGTKTEVVYGIDRNADSIYSDVDIVSLEDNLEEVDAVVVRAFTFSEKVNCPILSLEDILYEV